MTLLAVLGRVRHAAARAVPRVARAVPASSLRYFVPRLGRVAKQQADARSLMTGRITDAYTNIATVKLFSHAQREAAYARSAMQEFLATVHAQMRLVTGFEIVNHILSAWASSPPRRAPRCGCGRRARSASARSRRPPRWRCA